MPGIRALPPSVYRANERHEWRAQIEAVLLVSTSARKQLIKRVQKPDRSHNAAASERRGLSSSLKNFDKENENYAESNCSLAIPLLARHVSGQRRRAAEIPLRPARRAGCD